MMKFNKTHILLCALSILLFLPSISFSVCKEAEDSLFLAENEPNFETKIEHYTAALSKCPDNMEILTTLTDTYIDYEYYDAAYGVIYRILSLNKFNAEGYYKLAYIYMMWEEYDQAQDAAEKALSINSYYVDNFLLLGDLKYYTRDYKEAMKYYKKALEIDPNNSDAYIKIAGLFFLFEKYDKVVAYLDKSLSIEKTTEIEMLKKLMTKSIKNDYEGVKEVSEQILEKDPKNLMALEVLSMAMLEHENEKSNCLEVLTKVYYLEKQPFMKNKVEKEIERIVSSIAALNPPK